MSATSSSREKGKKGREALTDGGTKNAVPAGDNREKVEGAYIEKPGVAPHDMKKTQGLLPIAGPIK